METGSRHCREPRCDAARCYTRLTSCCCCEIVFPTKVMAPTIFIARIAIHPRSTPHDCTRKLGDVGREWWLLWSASPPVSHASQGMFVAVFEKVRYPHQWQRPLMEADRPKTYVPAWRSAATRPGIGPRSSTRAPIPPTGPR